MRSMVEGAREATAPIPLFPAQAGIQAFLTTNLTNLTNGLAALTRVLAGAPFYAESAEQSQSHAEGAPQARRTITRLCGYRLSARRSRASAWLCETSAYSALKRGGCREARDAGVDPFVWFVRFVVKPSSLAAVRPPPKKPGSPLARGRAGERVCGQTPIARE